MKKLLLGLELAIYAIAVILLVVFGIVNHFNEVAFKVALFASMISGLLGLVLVLISVSMKNDLKRLTCAIHTSIVAIAVVFYYLANNFLEFSKNQILLWVLYASITCITVVVLTILNFKLPDRKLVMKK